MLKFTSILSPRMNRNKLVSNRSTGEVGLQSVVSKTKRLYVLNWLPNYLASKPLNFLQQVISKIMTLLMIVQIGKRVWNISKIIVIIMIYYQYLLSQFCFLMAMERDRSQIYLKTFMMFPTGLFFNGRRSLPKWSVHILLSQQTFQQLPLSFAR